MISQDLLEILRCPACVSDPERREKEADPGLLDMARGTWLVCQSPGCGRKYPIKDDIPIMLIDEGDKWVNVPVEELGEPESEVAQDTGPERTSEPLDAAPSRTMIETQPAVVPVAGVLLLLALAMFILFWRRGSTTTRLCHSEASAPKNLSLNSR